MSLRSKNTNIVLISNKMLRRTVNKVVVVAACLSVALPVTIPAVSLRPHAKSRGARRFDAVVRSDI